MATPGQVLSAGAGERNANQAVTDQSTVRRKRAYRRIQFPGRFFILFSLGLLVGAGLQAQEAATETPFPPLDSSSPASSAPDSSSCAFPSSSLSAHDRELTIGDRFDIYFTSLREPEALIRPVLGGAYDQAINTPPEWGQGAQGFGRRVGSGFATEIIARTISFGVAAADHEDPRFYRSQLHGFWPRTRYAVVHTFVSRIDGGGQTFAFSRIAGIYGSAFIANAWYPAGYNDFAHGLSRGSTNLAVDVGYHVLREFAPDIKKLFRHK